MLRAVYADWLELQGCLTCTWWRTTDNRTRVGDWLSAQLGDGFGDGWGNKRGGGVGGHNTTTGTALYGRSHHNFGDGQGAGGDLPLVPDDTGDWRTLVEGRYLLVLAHGFVVIAEVHNGPDWLTIWARNAATARRWGTTTGLSELAKTGPTRDSLLDLDPDSILTRSQIIRAIPMSEQAWENYLNFRNLAS